MTLGTLTNGMDIGIQEDKGLKGVRHAVKLGGVCWVSPVIFGLTSDESITEKLLDSVSVIDLDLV